jgi:hypothetical protein
VKAEAPPTSVALAELTAALVGRESV